MVVGQDMPALPAERLMENEIMTDKPTLVMKQAPDAVHEWMHRCKADIDCLFYEGYAAEHPELLGAMIQACAVDQLGMHTYGRGDDVSRSLESVSNQVSGLGNAVSCELADGFAGLRSDVQGVSDTINGCS